MTLESPPDSKEIKPVNPKGNQPWIFIGSTDAEAEAPILRSPHAKSRLIVTEQMDSKEWLITRHMVVLFLVFWGPSIVFSTVAAPIYIPTNSIEGLPFFHILTSIYYL